jgi:peptide/nickel transport system substrate-binding protein
MTAPRRSRRGNRGRTARIRAHRPRAHRAWGSRGRGEWRRAAALAATLLAPIGVLAGCDRVGSPQPAAVRGLDLASTEPRATSAATGGTLRLVTGTVDSLDPARSYAPGVWNVMRLYTRQLVTFATKPGDAGTRVVPDLATSLGQTTDGGRTWVYRLRPGLRWDDGRPVTARDVKYGIERMFASDLLAGGPTWVVSLLDDRAAPYDGPYRDRTPGRLGLRSVSTPDDRTVVFRLVRPFADWDKVLALPGSTPVPADRDGGARYGAHPASLGPYQVAGPNSRGVLTFTRNRFWSRAVDPVRAALPDRIELATDVLPAERDRRVLTGQADADLSGSGLQPEGAATVLADPALAARADDPTTGTLRLLAMPGAVQPFENVHCRKAVQYAVDKAAMKEAVGGASAAALATTLWPRALPGYPAVAPYPGGEGNRGDEAAARAELTRCGRPDGFAVNLAVVADGRGPACAAATVRALARVGIRVTVATYPRSQFRSVVAGAPAVVRRDRLGLILADWSADFPSPYAFLVPLADSRSIRPSGNPNLAELGNAGLEQAVDEATATLDPVQATRAWRDVETLVMQAAAYAPLIEDRALLLAGARLRNVYVHPVYHGYDVVSLGVS